MQDLNLKWKWKNIFFLSILVIFLICLFWLISINFFMQSKFNDSGNQIFSKTEQKNSIAARMPNQIPFTPYIIPVGTQMIIPPWIMQQYQLSEQQAIYENALDFIIYNYGVAAPSVSDKGQDTYYIPLSVYGDEYDSYESYDRYEGGDYFRNTVMVDVTSLAMDNTVSPTVQDSPVLQPSLQPIEPSPTLSDPMLPIDEKPPMPNMELSEKPEIIFTTTKPVDITKAPDVSTPVEEPDLSTTYPATCDKMEEKTEASAPCTHCVQLNEKSDTKDFLNTVNIAVQSFNRAKDFPSIVGSFCKNCHGVNVNDFFQYIEERAKSENVPPSIMFAFILRESNGDCNAGGDMYKSYGLFQLNITNSTKLKPCADGELSGLNPQQMKDVCIKGEYKKQGYPKMKGQCLNNPYCNFEEAFHLLKEEKWAIANGNTPKPVETNWVEMSAEERNLWRDAIISYNGAGYLKSAEKRMKNHGLSSQLDNWEIKRIFFVKSYLYNKSKHEQCGKSGSREDRRCRAKYNPHNIIHNLAYVERITGRETKRGLVNSSMCQWIQFRKNNSNLSCK